MGMYNQQTIKGVNKKQLYRLVNEEPGISRIQLANRTNLSKTTVSALIDELIQEGYLTDEGTIDSKRQGRKPNSLIVNSKDNCFLILNWKKRSLDLAMVTASYDVAFCREEVLDSQKNYADQMHLLIEEFLQDQCLEKQILGICLIVPGMIDSENEKIISMVLDLEDQQKVIEELRGKIPACPIAVFNDTACFAYAENAFGEMRGKNYVYLNMNEGVGAALVYEGNILNGATGMGTQFGHYSVDRNGETCVCGNRGCLENRIGELALHKRAEECDALTAFEAGKQILFKDVRRLEAEGNPAGLRMIHAIANDLGCALSNLIVMFHPEVIMIGGVGRKLGPVFLDEVRKTVKETGFRQFVSNMDIRYTNLGEGAIFQGAAKYYMDMHYDFIGNMNNKLFLH